MIIKPQSPQSQRVRWFLRILGILFAVTAAVVHIKSNASPEYAGQIFGALAILFIMVARFAPDDIILKIEKLIVRK